MIVTNFLDAQFGMIKYPLCGNYDDGDNEYECPNFDPDEELEMMFDEEDLQEMREN